MIFPPLAKKVSECLDEDRGHQGRVPEIVNELIKDFRGCVITECEGEHRTNDQKDSEDIIESSFHIYRLVGHLFVSDEETSETDYLTMT